MRVFLWLSVVLASCSALWAQEQSDSPVYKNYRSPSPSSFIKGSDVNYNLMQLFILERKANSSDAVAQHELGLRYLLGEGVTADTIKGAYWIGKAAEQDFQEAHFNMGILFFNGWGVPWNPFEAYKHLLYCAGQNVGEAQHIIGMFYTENLIIARNWEEAYRWVKKSAASGYAPAKETMEDMEKRGLGVPKRAEAKRDTSSKKTPTHTLGFVFQDSDADTSAQASDATLLKDALREATPQLKKALGLSNEGDPSKAGGPSKSDKRPVGKSPEANLSIDSLNTKIISDAAEEGSPEALAILGRSYERGIGVQRDLILAALHYIRATRMSSPRAPQLLARLLEKKEFFSTLKARVDRNDPDALFVWSTLTALRLDYFMTKEPQNFITEKQALELLNKAVALNHVQAIIELGLCYYSGRWIPESREKALELWNRAAHMGSKEAHIRLATLSVQSAQDTTARKAAISLLAQAAQAGSVLAQVALGYCYETGTGVTKQPADAAKLYRSAAQRGSRDAYFALRRMHDALRLPGKEYVITEME